MTTPTIPFNVVMDDPSITDALNELSRSVFLDLSCHHVGTIQSFDATKQTATATINYKQTYFELNSVTGKYDSVLVDYPILIDCPVICLGGGPASLTFPIAQGDECLILFNDRDFCGWFQGSANSAVPTPRLHSTSDGIIIVGIRSLAKVLSNYDTTRACLKNGSALVGVGPALIKVANAQYTLNGLLQELITEVKNLVTATAAITVSGVTSGSGASGVPVNAAVITAIGTNITATAAKIAGLLE